MVLLISSAEHSKLDLSPAEKKSPAASLAVVNAVEMPVYLSLGKNPDQEIKKNYLRASFVSLFFCQSHMLSFSGS